MENNLDENIPIKQMYIGAQISNFPSTEDNLDFSILEKITEETGIENVSIYKDIKSGKNYYINSNNEVIIPKNPLENYSPSIDIYSFDLKSFKDIITVCSNKTKGTLKENTNSKEPEFNKPEITLPEREETWVRNIAALVKFSLDKLFITRKQLEDPNEYNHYIHLYKLAFGDPLTKKSPKQYFKDYKKSLNAKETDKIYNSILTSDDLKSCRYTYKDIVNGTRNSSLKESIKKVNEHSQKNEPKGKENQKGTNDPKGKYDDDHEL